MCALHTMLERHVVHMVFSRSAWIQDTHRHILFPLCHADVRVGDVVWVWVSPQQTPTYIVGMRC